MTLANFFKKSENRAALLETLGVEVTLPRPFIREDGSSTNKIRGSIKQQTEQNEQSYNQDRRWQLECGTNEVAHINHRDIVIVDDETYSISEKITDAYGWTKLYLTKKTESG